MSCMAATSYPLSQKENDKRMGLASHTVPKMAMITINILLAGGFITYLLVLTSLYPHRFSDRDLLMRYHWGLGIGHFHAHQLASTSGCASDLAEDAQDIQVPDMELQETSAESPAQASDQASDVGFESDNPELCLEDRDSEGWDDIEMDDIEDGDGDEDEDTGEAEDFSGMY
jgi:hypothetical protein